MAIQSFLRRGRVVKSHHTMVGRASSGWSCSFWAYSIPPGGTLSQDLSERGASVSLTSAVLAEKCSQPVTLTVTCNGVSLVLCTLSSKAGQENARLSQPFHGDFELSVSPGGVGVHVSGFAKGDLGPVELLTENGGAVPKGGARWMPPQMGLGCESKTDCQQQLSRIL